jgi:tRNA G37 N-methylase TrmD
VPDVLLSGHHERIGEWRLARSAERGPGQAAEEEGER